MEQPKGHDEGILPPSVPFVFFGGESMNEERQRLAYYLQLPKEIERLEQQERIISKAYYLTHSMVGSTPQVQHVDHVQKATSPFHAVMEILALEHATNCQKNRLIRRFSLFSEEFTTDELEQLKSELSSEYDTPLIVRACEWLSEIDFYLEAHQFSEPEEKASKGVLQGLEDLLTQLEV